MKGKDLIENIIQEEVPTAEDIRANCLAWRPETRHRPLRLVKVAIVFAALLVFTTAAYAVGSYINRQRFDTGGHVEYVIVPFDSPEYQERLTGPSYGPLYFSPNHEDSWRFPVQPSRASHSSERAQIIRDVLDGRIFTADGLPFDLMLPAGTGYRAYGGYALFTADGYEISHIYVREKFHDVMVYEILGAVILTFEGTVCGDEDGRFAGHAAGMGQYRHTYEEAAAFLGRDFLLPSVHTELFEPPVFEVAALLTTEAICSGVVTMRLRGCGNNSDIMIFLEPIRDEDTAPRELLLADGEITVFDEVNGVTIYQVTGFWHSTHFIWTYDGIVHKMYSPIILRNDPNPPPLVFSTVYCDCCGKHSSVTATQGRARQTFTDQQIREFIRSMIE